MHNEFSTVIQKTKPSHIAFPPEMPGANGRGKTLDKCRKSLPQSMALLLEDRREYGMRGVPADATIEGIVVETGMSARPLAW